MLVCQSKSKQVGLNTEEIKHRLRGSTSAKGVIRPTLGLGKGSIDYLIHDAVNTKTDQQGISSFSSRATLLKIQLQTVPTVIIRQQGYIYIYLHTPLTRISTRQSP